MRRLSSVLIAGLFLAGVTLTAWAALVTVQDPNDTQGLFDVRTVRFDPERPPEWTVITFGSWTTKGVWDKGYVLVYLDTLGNHDPDYFALIRSDGDDMRADLYRDLANDRLLRHLIVWRNGSHQVSVRIPLRFVKIGPKRTLYRWSALTLYTSANCKVPCIDLVPDDGMVDETLSPSPTPTPTPTSPGA
ncbi:MAG TPA: hypothetical protein VH989_08000 [Actinomycetota bacterium]